MDLDRKWHLWPAFKLPRSSVRRVDLDLSLGLSFDLSKNSDPWYVRVSIKLNKGKDRIFSYLKFNTYLLDEKDFKDQLELM